MLVLAIERIANRAVNDQRGVGSSLVLQPWPALRGLDEPVGEEHFTDPARVILTLSSLRVFSNVRSIQAIFFGLLAIMPSFTNVALLMLSTMHIYAIVGCLLMGGTFMFLQENDQAAANYNSLFDAWLTMYQLLVGEAWNGLMLAGVGAVGGYITFFFMSYTVLMTLLFTNLVVGIFVNANDKVAEANAQSGTTTTLDMKRILTESGGNKKFIELHHPERAGDPVLIRKVRRRRATTVASPAPVVTFAEPDSKKSNAADNGDDDDDAKYNLIELQQRNQELERELAAWRRGEKQVEPNCLAGATQDAEQQGGSDLERPKADPQQNIGKDEEEVLAIVESKNGHDASSDMDSNDDTTAATEFAGLTLDVSSASSGGGERLVSSGMSSDDDEDDHLHQKKHSGTAVVSIEKAR